MITLIAAVARNGVIGMGNTIPWHLPEDFRLFKESTNGHPIIMGSATWDSLPRKPLPNRTNIVVSRTPRDTSGVIWVKDIETALDEAGAIDDNIFVIGGASIYQQTIGIADRMLISWVELTPEGDTFFPQMGKEWVVVSECPYRGFVLTEYHKEG